VDPWVFRLFGDRRLEALVFKSRSVLSDSRGGVAQLLVDDPAHLDDNLDHNTPGASGVLAVMAGLCYVPAWSDFERCLEQYGRILSATTKYTPKDDIRRFVCENSCAAQFDFAAYFDQFALAGSIRKYFGITRRSGDDLQLCVLAMGFRPSCQVAQATTHPGSRVGPCCIACRKAIDN
jgi:hypothetical protein